MWFALIYLITFVLSLAVFVGLIAALPANYFIARHDRWIDQHPLVRWLLLIGKNLLGMAIIAVGVLLSLPGIPGQGLLTIVVGMMLLSIPGKRRLVRRIVHRPGMLRRLNRLRSWFGRPPLQVD